MTKCIICSKPAIFKIKGEKIYYCKNHAEEFFSSDCLLNVKYIEKGAKDAEKLKEFLKSNLK